MALDVVMSFLHLKDITITCKHMRHSPTIGGISSVQGWKLEEAEDFKCLLVVYCVLESNLPCRVAQSVTCLATDACLTAIHGVASSIPAQFHTFVEIDHEIISTVILLPSAD